MAWPPPIPPSTRTNSTAQSTTHPTDHNQIHAALAELVAQLTTSIVASPVTTGYTGSANVYKTGRTCILQVSLSRDSGDLTSNGGAGIATLPVSVRPTLATVYGTCIGTPIASELTVLGQAIALSVDNAGAVRLASRIEGVGRFRGIAVWALSG